MDFDVFRPSQDPDLEYWIGDRSLRPEIANAYDNSIRYTNFLVSEVIATLREYGGHSALMYVSDHGENLLDDERDLIGHGATTVYDMRIPLLVWLSDAYAEKFSGVRGALIANREKRVSHDNVFFTLLDLARIRHRFEDARETLGRRGFEERDRNILTGSMDVVRCSSLLDDGKPPSRTQGPDDVRRDQPGDDPRSLRVGVGVAHPHPVDFEHAILTVGRERFPPALVGRTRPR